MIRIPYLKKNNSLVKACFFNGRPGLLGFFFTSDHHYHSEENLGFRDAMFFGSFFFATENTTKKKQMVVNSKGNPRNFQGNRSVGEIL